MGGLQMGSVHGPSRVPGLTMSTSLVDKVGAKAKAPKKERGKKKKIYK